LQQNCTCFDFSTEYMLQMLHYTDSMLSPVAEYIPDAYS